MDSEEIKRFILKDVKVTFPEGREDYGILFFSDFTGSFILRHYRGDYIVFPAIDVLNMEVLEPTKIDGLLDTFVKYEDLFSDKCGLEFVMYAYLSTTYALQFLADLLEGHTGHHSDEWLHLALLRGEEMTRKHKTKEEAK